MFLLGLLLLAAGVVAAAMVLLADGNGTGVTVSLYDQASRSTSVRGVFLLGLAVGAVALLGLWMLLGGMSRARSRRVQRRQTARQRENEQRELRERNAELERQLAVTRSAEQRRHEATAGATASAPVMGGGRSTTAPTHHSESTVEAYPEEPQAVGSDAEHDDSSERSLFGLGRHRR